MRTMPSRIMMIALAALALFTARAPGQGDPLPSWNDGPPRRAILDFADRVTREGSPSSSRLKTGSPCSTTMALSGASNRPTPRPFSSTTASAPLAPQHPEWAKTQPFKAVLEGDRKELAAFGSKALVELITATHGGMTDDDFRLLVRDWMASAHHPRFNRLHTQCVYQPMLDLLAFLRSRSFKTYIVTGGGIGPCGPSASESTASARAGRGQHHQAAVRDSRREACHRSPERG